MDLFIVFRWVREDGQFDCRGVFGTKDLAEAQCTDDQCLVCPCKLDDVLPGRCPPSREARRDVAGPLVPEAAARLDAGAGGGVLPEVADGEDMKRAAKCAVGGVCAGLVMLVFVWGFVLPELPPGEVFPPLNIVMSSVAFAFVGSVAIATALYFEL